LSRILAQLSLIAPFFQLQAILRPRRDTRIPLKYRKNSPPRLDRSSNQHKWRRIKIAGAERYTIDQALAQIAVTSECSTEPLAPILTKFPQSAGNYVPNRAEASRYISLSEIEIFTLFFDDVIVKILTKETNAYAEIHQLTVPCLGTRFYKCPTAERATTAQRATNIHSYTKTHINNSVLNCNVYNLLRY
jgi:hypothetical protein